MVTIQSLIKVADKLVPVEEFAGPIPDEDYIEGALELSIENRPILTREQIDYVDQLWAYLVRGLGEVVAGREFSTFYPDMPVEIVLCPHGDQVTIKVDTRASTAEASVATVVLCRAMVSTGTRFFEKMRELSPANREMYSRYIADLAALAATVK